MMWKYFCDTWQGSSVQHYCAGHLLSCNVSISSQFQWDMGDHDAVLFVQKYHG